MPDAEGQPSCFEVLLCWLFPSLYCDLLPILASLHLSFPCAKIICLQLHLSREEHILLGIELGWLKGCRSKQVFFTWSPIVFQDNLRKKDDRIEELEEALRESVQITAEREMVLAQEESARINAEKQVWNLIKSLVVLLGNSKLLFPLLYCET